MAERHVLRTSRMSTEMARVTPMQAERVDVQGVRWVHRMRLMTARKTCTAELCAAKPALSQSGYQCTASGVQKRLEQQASAGQPSGSL